MFSNNFFFSLFCVAVAIYFGYLQYTGKIQWTLNWDREAHYKESLPSRYAGNGLALGLIPFILLFFFSGCLAYYNSSIIEYTDKLLPIFFFAFPSIFGFIGYFLGKRIEKKGGSDNKG
jgi:hypothetical protein